MAAKIDLSNILKMLEQVVDDRKVPRNIRMAVEDSKKALEDEELSSELKISTAITTLDEIINDSNMPMHTRIQIWNIVSMLEQARTG